MATYYSPDEKSPRKGSRDLMLQDADEWGSQNFTSYLGGSWGDPHGILNPDQVSAWKNQAMAPYNTGAIEGFDAESFFTPGRSETPFDFSGTPFTDIRPGQLEALIAQLSQGTAGTDDAQWAPTLREYDGKQYVQTGKQNVPDSNNIGTFISDLMPYIVPAALGGFAASGAAAGGAGAGAGGAFDMGIGGIGESMGLGGGGAGFGAGGAMDMGIGGIAESMGLGGEAFGAGGAMDMGVGGIGESMGLNGDVGGMSDLFSPNNNLWNDVAQGWEGGQAASAAQNAQLAGNPLQQTLEQLKTLMTNPSSFGNPMDLMKKRFSERKDPLALVGSLMQWMNSRKQGNQIEKTLKDFQQQGFPHQNFYQMAQEWLTDPAKRYAYLQGTSGFMASQDYVKEAQKRKNAKNGYLSSGYGDALTSTVLGQNAASWDDQLFKQISQASGMGFNNQQSNAQLTSGLLPGMFNIQNQGNQALFEGVRKNQGFLPEIFRTLLT